LFKVYAAHKKYSQFFVQKPKAIYIRGKLINGFSIRQTARLPTANHSKLQIGQTTVLANLFPTHVSTKTPFGSKNSASQNSGNDMCALTVGSFDLGKAISA